VEGHWVTGENPEFPLGHRAKCYCRPEAAIALRQRLNETVEQLDTLRKEHTEMEVKFEVHQPGVDYRKIGPYVTVPPVLSNSTDHTTSVNLVNKDQLDILNSLRESVNEDKASLEEEVQRLQKQIRDLSDKNKMQLEQVNALLLDKISMQSEGLGQRERMLEREREFTDLKTSFAGKDLPEEIKTRLLGLHEENTQLKEQIKTTQEKLNRAKQFIKDQDKLFREEHGKNSIASEVCSNAFSLNDTLMTFRSPALSTKMRKQCDHRSRSWKKKYRGSR
jgi:protein HOOK3